MYIISIGILDREVHVVSLDIYMCYYYIEVVSTLYTYFCVF